jgi:hypothetical protein
VGDFQGRADLLFVGDAARSWASVHDRRIHSSNDRPGTIAQRPSAGKIIDAFCVAFYFAHGSSGDIKISCAVIGGTYGFAFVPQRHRARSASVV